MGDPMVQIEPPDTERLERVMPNSKYARDKVYGKPPKWGQLYGAFFPEHTDGCSRHAVMIADEILRAPKSPVRRWLIDNGYEPDHWASSIEATVEGLWRERAALKEQAPDFWQARREQQYREAGIEPPYNERGDG